MAHPKRHPYSQFHFLVTWEQADGTTADAGFSEVSGLEMEVGVAEYRVGSANASEPIKVTGGQKMTHTTLKRGVIGAKHLYEWLNLVREGHQDQLRTVTITLLSESGEETARWRLLGAMPVKWTGPSLNSNDTDVAIEELVLSVEGIEREAK